MFTPFPAGVGPARSLRRLRRRLGRTVSYSDRTAVLALVVSALLLTVAGVLVRDLVPFSILLLPMFVGSLWLGPRTLPWVVAFCLGCSLVVVVLGPSFTDRTLIRVVILFVVGLIIMATSLRRGRLGVSGPRGEAMLEDLRDRITRQGRLPDLPEDWYVDVVTRSAGTTSFAGDFVVASRSADGASLDVVVVDVSGKGVEAGTRSLLLSGAFGGLLSALTPPAFLPAANDYLLRQSWDEGFATAIHLHLDLHSGCFALRKAGHPPAVWLHAGSGRWSVLESEGSVLGLLPDESFEVLTGVLERGDGLLMYTDGLVETVSRDIASGIDRLAGRAERLLATGFENGAHRLVDELEMRGDDRALMLVHRRR